jgi:hypothetical protein
MRRLMVRSGLLVIHLGRVERDDLIVQMADFCLQFESVEWVAVSGRLGRNLVVAVRNHGFGRANAGETVKRLFADIGSAGGHRNMAKAVVSLAEWRGREGSTRDKMIEARLGELFAAVVPGQHEDSEPRVSHNGDATRRIIREDRHSVRSRRTCRAAVGNEAGTGLRNRVIPGARY